MRQFIHPEFEIDAIEDLSILHQAILDKVRIYERVLEFGLQKSSQTEIKRKADLLRKWAKKLKEQFDGNS